jgi:protein required for attachment to host cells
MTFGLGGGGRGIGVAVSRVATRIAEREMPKLSIPHDGLVFVGDGRKALFLRNEGDEKFLVLKTEQVVVGEENPATREQGSGRPGRVHQSLGEHRSSVEQTDWHEIEEKRFAKEVAAALLRVVRERSIKTIVVIAPPRTLAELRRVLHAEVKTRIAAEIDKDLTKMPLHEIEKHLIAKHLAA